MDQPRKITFGGRLKAMFRWENLPILVSLVLFIICLTQPAFYVDRKEPYGNGFLLLLIGWMGVIAGGGFSWLANPLYLAGLILSMYDCKKSAIFSGLSVIVAASFMLSRSVMRDEAGHMTKVTSLGPGYKIWLLSCAILFSGTLWQWLAHKNRQV